MPTPDAYGQGINLTQMTDPPNIPDAIASLAGGVIPRCVMRFASASARGATLVGAQAPVEGMLAWLQDTNLLTLYDGTQWTVLAAGAQTWTSPALATGYTNNGNLNGNIGYRLVNLFGEPTVMWRGGLTPTYSGGLPVNGGNFLSLALPAALRPTSLRTVTAACSGVNSNSMSIKIDFRPTGVVEIVNDTGVTPIWISLNNVMYSL
ncbi:hypothetical protein [Streptomyces sp. NPDC059783]|uniref:hypothetical protein n=1 Tax=Streptomyces sp. NPDC059783 TaxID=3346944 RepID=UPI00365E66B4